MSHMYYSKNPNLKSLAQYDFLDSDFSTPRTIFGDWLIFPWFNALLGYFC